MVAALLALLVLLESDSCLRRQPVAAEEVGKELHAAVALSVHVSLIGASLCRVTPAILHCTSSLG